MPVTLIKPTRRVAPLPTLTPRIGTPVVSPVVSPAASTAAPVVVAPVVVASPVVAAPASVAPVVVVAPAPEPVSEVVVQPAPRRDGRRLALVLGGLAVLIVAVVLFAGPLWDRVADRIAYRTARWSTPTTVVTPPALYSNARGAEDAPRAEVTQSRRADRERCMDTLRLRRVDLQTAADTCNKMIAGIYHG